MAANRAACAVGHHQPVGLNVKRAFGRFHRQRGVCVVACHRRHLVLPADVGPQFEGAGNEHLLDVVLLQVDHAGALVAGIGHQVELVDLVFFQKGAANVPAHAQAAGLVGNAQAVQDFERALGVTHRPRADRDGLVVVQHQHLKALQTRIDGRRQAHRPCANHDQRFALRRCGHQVGRRLVGINRVDVSTHVQAPNWSKSTLWCSDRNLPLINRFT